MGKNDSGIRGRVGYNDDWAYELNKEEKKEGQKYPGKEKCEKLRQILKLIAEVNGIRFEPDVCHHEGPCAGTCPACDAEIRYLDELLQLKKKRGEEVIMSGLSLDIGSSCSEDESDIDDLVDGNSSFVGDVDGEVPVRDTEEDEMITTGKIIPYI